MEYNNLVSGTLIKRENRFVAKVKVAGKIQFAHVPNTGRLKELMQPGAEVFLKPGLGKERKTPWDLVFVKGPNNWVAIDSRLSTTLFAEALENGDISELRGTEIEKKEIKFGNSRLDFKLRSSSGPIYVEVKSVNLVNKGTALFPDAPTLRGSRHIDELIKAQKEGARSLLFFSVQREDGEIFSPHYSMDPLFAGKVEEAIKEGVLVLAYKCKICFPLIRLKEKIEVKLKK